MLSQGHDMRVSMVVARNTDLSQVITRPLLSGSIGGPLQVEILISRRLPRIALLLL